MGGQSAVGSRQSEKEESSNFVLKVGSS